MQPTTYRDPDYLFGQAMLTLRTAIGLTQASLAAYLGVSRHALVAWESGASYPKPNRLKQFIALAAEQHAFPVGREAAEIRELWRMSRQKILLDENWLASLLAQPVAEPPLASVVEPVPASPPPAPVAPRVASNLPLQTTPFIGRDAEKAEVAKMLADPACRLLTLLGPGGIGKTRLALEVAEAQSANYADGVLFVALAPVDTANQIVSAIGDALGVRFSDPNAPGAQLIRYLSERQLLLALDNLEHLLEGADLVNAILVGAPGVTLIVTSRERLNLRAEWVFDVEGLAYPPERAPIEQADPGEYGAVQLFMQRAAQVQPGFASTMADLALIGRICRNLSGMPLAIELAAALVRQLPLHEIERQIGYNLDVLATTYRDVPRRHRSMSAVFDQSWNLLGEPERVLFSRLAVFRGGGTAGAAARVAGATLPRLLALVDKSLLRPDSVASPPDLEPRFALLEPLREYALEKLAARGEAERLSRNHALYFMELTETAAAQWESAQTLGVIAQVERDYDNIRAALAWARDGGDRVVGLQLATALRRFWQLRGYYTEGRQWLKELLLPDAAEPSRAAQAARARALHVAAWLASDQHDYARATQLYQESMDLREALGEPDSDTRLLAPAARQARAAGEYRRAVELLRDLLARHRALGDRGSFSSGGIGLTIYELGLALREQGDYEEAGSLFKECLQLHHALGDREGIAVALLGMSDLARDQADVAGMREYCARSLAVSSELGMMWARGFALNNLALAALLDNDIAQAAALANESAALFRSAQADSSLGEILITQGYIMLAQGDSAAYPAMREAARLAETLGPRLLEAFAIEGLASLLALWGSLELAVRAQAAASALRAVMGVPRRPLDAALENAALSKARLTLGARLFDSMWRQGATESLAEINAAITGVETGAATARPAQATPAIAPPVEQTGELLPTAGTRVDWSDAPAIDTFYGREHELSVLREWVVGEQSRLVSVLGLGGIGKSSLAARLMRDVAYDFQVVIWRSARDAPSCAALLESCLRGLAPQPLDHDRAALSGEQGQEMLLERMRGARILIVLDNVETMLEEGDSAGRLRAGYEEFGRILRRVADSEHQSCIVLTSRETPGEIALREDSDAHVRSLRLTRLDGGACARLLAERQVGGGADERQRLIDAYDGNPLALKIVAQTIQELFGGAIGPFLAQGGVVFGGVRDLLAGQFKRLSQLEQSVLLWLAIMREPVSFDALRGAMVEPLLPGQSLELVESLLRRNLIERAQGRASFTLQSVVLEYVTARLVVDISDEIRQGQPARLFDHGLTLARSREYVRQAQERLLVAPVLERLRLAYPEQAELEQRLLALLDELRARSDYAQGYGPANLLVLLKQHRGDLRGLDLSRLTLRDVYFQGVAMQDATLSNALIHDGIFTNAFDTILNVDISGNGRYWAASTGRGEIWLWEVETTGSHNNYILSRIWQSPNDVIWKVALSADGLLIAGGAWDGEVKVWDLASGALRWSSTRAASAGRVYSLKFSPDNKLLAASTLGVGVRLWAADSGELLQSLPHPSPVEGVDFSADGRFLATGDQAGLVRLWQVAPDGQATCVQTLVGHTQTVPDLDFAPEGRLLASVSLDGTFKLWDVAETYPAAANADQPAAATARETHRGLAGPLRRLAWSADKRTLALAGTEPTIWLWDVEQRAYRSALRGHSGRVWGLAFTPDGSNLLSGGEDGTMRVWDATSGERLQVIEGFVASINDVEWSPDSARLASAGDDGLVTVYDLHGAAPRTIQRHETTVVGLSWNPDGQRLATLEWINAIQICDPQTGAVIQTLSHPTDPNNRFYGLAWSPNGQFLASGTIGYGLLVWDSASATTSAAQHYNLLWPAQPFPTSISCRVVWSPDGAYVAGGCDNGTVYIWDAVQGTLVQQLAGHHSPIQSVAWSPGGGLLASGSRGAGGGELIVWDVADGTQRRAFTTQSAIVFAVAWGQSDEVVIGGASDGALCWWNMHSGDCVITHEAHQGRVRSLRRSPDGTRLASFGHDGAIMVWDLASGAFLQELRRDRPYERLNISGIRGLTQAQKQALRSLGALDNESRQRHGV